VSSDLPALVEHCGRIRAHRPVPVCLALVVMGKLTLSEMSQLTLDERAAIDAIYDEDVEAIDDERFYRWLMHNDLADAQLRQLRRRRAS